MTLFIIELCARDVSLEAIVVYSIHPSLPSTPTLSITSPSPANLGVGLMSTGVCTCVYTYNAREINNSSARDTLVVVRTMPPIVNPCQ